MEIISCLLLVLLFAESSFGQETFMARKGKLLFDDTCEKGRGKKLTPLNDDWSVRAVLGKWEKKKGFYQSSWKRGMGHTPVMVYLGEYKNVIIEVTFRANKMTKDWHTQCFRIALDNRSLYTGHVLSAWVNPNNNFIETGFLLQHISKEADKTIINDTLLDRQPLNFKEAEWQTAILEVVDKQSLFHMSENIAYAETDKTNVRKSQFSLTLGKTDHDIKRVRVWQATLKPDWPANKEKILAKRKPFKPKPHAYQKK